MHSSPRGTRVTVVDDLSRGRREQVNPGATFVELDITAPELAAAFAEARPEVVFHAAAQIDVRESVRDPLHDADVNVVGTVNVLRAAVDAGARRVVFASSGGRDLRRHRRDPDTRGSSRACPSRRTAQRSCAPRRTAGRSAVRRVSSSSRCATPTSTDLARIRTVRRASSPSSPPGSCVEHRW